MAMANVKVGQKVEVIGKDVVGTVAYIGATQFAAGKWIGLILDEPKGKNDGIVQGKTYFTCKENHGMFVRQTQIKLLGSNENSPARSSKTPSRENSNLTPRQKSDLAKAPARQKSDLATPKRQKSDLAKTPADPNKQESLESVSEETKEAPSAAAINSKLATPRSRLPLPGSGRQPSFTNITRKTVETPKPASAQQPFQRERSFVETNFVQTPKTSNITQILPEGSKTPSSHSKVASSASSVAASPTLTQVILSDKMEDKIAAIHLQQEINNYKDEIKDYQEKVETLKVKRAQDKEKMKDFEKLMIQNEQLLEFKGRIMEAQNQLQKEVQKARHDAKEAIDAKEQHAEEMSELSETVEMATLDKEMAEEKAETLQLELDACNEKIEELSLDLDIIKAEIGDGSKTGGEVGSVTKFELKALQAQNEKLRETLVSMRDLSAHEKHELGKLAKDLEEKVADLALKTKENEKLSKQVDEMEQTISDLQEQVDAALGAEEMVENLTTKCLDMEDRVAAMLEEKADLEALHDINEEMQENAREIELELREEIDLNQAKVREIQRDKEAALEVILDHENTINKFRSFVQQVQDQNRELKDALEKETSKPVSGTMGVSHEMLDFKKMFAETKAHAKAIDVELRKSEIQEAVSHVKFLMAYMSDMFTARGGDYEAIQVLLLVPRLSWKASILLGQVKDKFPVAETVDMANVLKGHSVDRYIFGTRVAHLLQSLTVTLHKFNSALNSCSVESFLRVGTLHPEMSVHEKGLDFYIDLLHKGQLDENVPVANLEKTVSYFETVYPLHLSDMKTDCPSFMADHVKVYLSGVENLLVEIRRARLLLDKSGESSAVGLLLKSMENQCKDLETQVKVIKRRLPQDGSQGPISFPESVASNMSQAANSINLTIKVLANFGKAAVQLATANPDSGVPAPKVQEALHTAVDTVTEFGDQGIEFCTNSLSSALAKLSVISASVQSGEYDFDGSREEKPAQPIFVRAEEVKNEIKDATQLKYKLEAKDIDIKDLKKLLKVKQEELSEMQVRKDLLEKKLSDSSKDSELMIEKLTRKLDDAHNLLRRKEKEFEETMDHLQADIEGLMSERSELKDRMKAMSKKALIEGLTKSASLSSPGPTSLGPSVPSPVRDSPLLVQQLQDMRTAVASLQSSVARVEAQEYRERIAKLLPIKLPSKTIGTGAEKEDRSKEAGADLGQLMSRCNKARTELYTLLATQPVVDITRTKGGVSNSGASMQEINLRKVREAQLRREVESLQLEVLNLQTSRKPGYKADTAFGTFASRDFARTLNQKDWSLYGRVDLSGSLKPTEAGIPLLTDRKGVLEIHNQMLA
eukprot:TRINITY_DN11349_c0_g1_i1.p1 TRINITY_DN11349_c0_g1~~TRINITY_DN11349_c0_g1_i1.p1  ORF type:complete len:1330 (-),score=541.02 TRINITY_DN11349_c0_g1_i1:124-4113(-)